jgi:hypothetical protein
MAVTQTSFAIAVCALAGCGARVERPAAPGKSPTQQMLALFESTCGDCHFEGADVPALGPQLTKDPHLAMRAALMLAARRMPPPPAKLATPTRREMISWLCHESQGGSACETWVNIPEPTEFVKSGDSFLRTMDVVLPRPAGQKKPPQEAKAAEILDHRIQYESVVFRLDPSYEAAILFTAVARCTPEGQKELDRECLKKWVQVESIRLPAPPDQINGEGSGAR